MFQSVKITVQTALENFSSPFPSFSSMEDGMQTRREEGNYEIVKPNCKDQTINFFHSSNNNLKINIVFVFEQSYNPCVICRQCSGDCDFSWPSLFCH